MDTILYFALWGGLIFLMMRLGCGSHMGHGHGQKHNHAQGGNAGAAGAEPRRIAPTIAPTKDVDPVCGNTVSTDKAKSSFFDGYVYYFCSRECREVFEAAPETYVGGDQRRNTGQLEHSHV